MASFNYQNTDVGEFLNDLMENPPAEGELSEIVEFLSSPDNIDVNYDPSKLVDDAVTYTDLLPPTGDLLSEPGNLTDMTAVTMVLDDKTYTLGTGDQIFTLGTGDQTFALGTGDQTFTLGTGDQTCTLMLSNGGILNVQDAEGSSYVTEVTETLNSDEMTVVSTAEVFGEAPKKRGRKRKSDESRPSRRQRPKKQKVYEIETPFEDEELERKRKNALNAKKHRDYQKKVKDDLVEKINVITAERDNLKKLVEEMQRREEALTRQLLAYQQNGVV